jgi:hypothetical protein
LLATATVADGGWIDLPEQITVRAGETFIVVPVNHTLDTLAAALLEDGVAGGGRGAVHRAAERHPL